MEIGHKSSFNTLDIFVSCLKKEYPGWGVLVEKHSLTADFINSLIENGWSISFNHPWIREGVPLDIRMGYAPPPFEYLYHPKCRVIGLHEELMSLPYDRDKTLLHEILHLHYDVYGGWLSRMLKEQVPKNPFGVSEEEIFIEWSSRKARANPDLLRCAVRGFDLEEHIYDYASYQAFGDKNPDEERYFKGLGTFLD